MPRSRSLLAALAVAALATGVPGARGQATDGRQAPTPKPAPAGPSLFRVILNDGAALASYGEFARVGDRVVFSMPIGDPGAGRLQTVSLPASAVNWEATERYSEAARYAQYVATRAEADFAVLTGEIARLLNEITLASDPARRLQIAQQARRLLNGWPADHYGYRSGDVREMSTLLDETISQIRASMGVREFDFSLVAIVDPPPMPLLPDPTLAQSIEQTMAASRITDIAAERMALLATVIGVLDESAGKLPKDWIARVRSAARATLESEAAASRKYARLAARAMRSATAAAADGNVRGVEGAIRKAARQARSLGRPRDEEMAALMGALQDRLDSARRLRLMRDQWQRRSAAFEEYKSGIAKAVDGMNRLRGRLEDVRALAGPPVGALPETIQRFERAYRQLRMVRPPDELSAAHATLVSAAELGQQAVRTRERATMTGDVRLAWDASAAASGSIMMLAQGRQQVEIASRPPELR
jgi:hypothetical protein